MGRDTDNLSDSDAHSLIERVLVDHDELHPSEVPGLAQWALDQSIKVDELEGKIEKLHALLNRLLAEKAEREVGRLVAEAA